MQNNQPWPLELQGHVYRKLFNLSYIELASEPIEQIGLSLAIEGVIRKQEERKAKHG